MELIALTHHVNHPRRLQTLGLFLHEQLWHVPLIHDPRLYETPKTVKGSFQGVAS
jgi:hypothetical protein